VAKYLHFWRGKISINNTHDIELLGSELHGPILFWFGDVGQRGSSSPSCRQDRTFGTLPSLMISQNPKQSPKTTIAKAKALIDSIHEYKRDSPIPKPIAIGIEKLETRVQVIGGMVIFQRGLLYSDAPCHANLMLRVVQLETHFKDNPDTIVLQRVHLASDNLHQWMQHDTAFVDSEDTAECWYPFTSSWYMQPAGLVVTLLIALSTPSGSLDDSDMIKLEKWSQKVKTSIQFKSRRVAQDVIDLQLTPAFDLSGPLTHSQSVKDYLLQYSETLQYEHLSQTKLR